MNTSVQLKNRRRPRTIPPKFDVPACPGLPLGSNKQPWVLVGDLAVIGAHLGEEIPHDGFLLARCAAHDAAGAEELQGRESVGLRAHLESTPGARCCPPNRRPEVRCA